MWLNLVFFLVLISFALLEVLTTGFLYDKFGVVKLSLLYLITTIFGIFFLSRFSKAIKQGEVRMKKISKTSSFKKLMSSWKDGEASFKSPEEKIVIMLTAQYILCMFAWIFILVPGLVTDFVSYIFILVIWVIIVKLKKPLTSSKTAASGSDASTTRPF